MKQLREIGRLGLPVPTFEASTKRDWAGVAPSEHEREIEERKLVVRTLPNGDREWRLDGKLHSALGKLAVEYADGGGEIWFHGEHLCTLPAKGSEHWRKVQGRPVVTRRRNGDREWRVEGKLHREDGPAVEYEEGGGEWWLHGVNHRDDGPAAVFPDGSFAWYRNGLPHRVGGPALWEPDGRAGWYRNGLPHREDGPAIFNPVVGYAWALEGELFLTEDDFNCALARREPNPNEVA